MDGLMFDSEPVYLNFQLRNLEEHGIAYDASALTETIGTYQPVDYHRLNRSDQPDELVKKIADEGYYKAIDFLLHENVPIKEGLIELLDVLDQRKIPYCVATSTPLRISGKMLEKAHLSDRLAFIVTGEQVKHGKPQPDIFLKAIEIAGVRKQEALILEDSINGATAAHNAGIPYIIIPDMKKPTPEVSKPAKAVLKSLLDVRELLENGEL